MQVDILSWNLQHSWKIIPTFGFHVLCILASYSDLIKMNSELKITINNEMKKNCGPSIKQKQIHAPALGVVGGGGVLGGGGKT